MSGRQVPNTINWAAGLFVAFAVAIFVMFGIVGAEPSSDEMSPMLIAFIVMVFILRKAWLLRKGRERARIAGIVMSTCVMTMSFLAIYLGVSSAGDIRTLFEWKNLVLLVTLSATVIGAIATLVLLLHGNSRNYTLAKDDSSEASGLGAFLRELFRRGIGELKEER